MNIKDIMSRFGGIPLRVRKDGTIHPEDLAALGPNMDRVLEKMGVEAGKREAKKAHAIGLLSRPGGVEDTIASMDLAAKLEAFSKLFASLKTEVDAFVAQVSQRPGAAPKLIVDLGESAGMLTIAGGILETSSKFIQHAMTCGCASGEHEEDDAERPTEAPPEPAQPSGEVQA